MSFGQLVIDNEIARMIKRVVQGITLNDETLAVDVIHQVGAGGHFLSEDHTYKFMKSEQTYPQIIDRNNRVRWVELGSPSMAQQAEEYARNILQNHQPDPLPAGVAEELRAIVEEAEAKLKENSQTN